MNTKSIYLRPKTRGELLTALKAGVACEVVESNEEITNIFLDGWLNFKNKYKTSKSDIYGWAVYEAI